MCDASAEDQLDTFLARFQPGIAELALEVRDRVRGILPPGFELVYDNYNALVIGFGPSERSSEAVLSIAVYPRWVRLFFLHGADLEDPDARLEGGGNQVRSLTVASIGVLDDPAVTELIHQAVARSPRPFGADPTGRMIIKSVAAKQRPRRPPD